METSENFRTLVALRSKQGEFAALRELSEDRAVQPLLLLDDGSASAVDTLLDRVENAVRHLWGVGRITMLDASKTNISTGGGASAVLRDLMHRLNAPTTLFQDESVPFVPVVDAGAEPSLIAGVGGLADEIGHGCALRLPIRTTPAPHLWDHLRIEPTEIDLIVDAGYIAGLDPDLVDDVLQLLANTRPYGEFRSVTILSGSVPKSLDQLHLWEQPRFEEILWQAVRADAGTDVRFGDYGAVHPVAGKGWPSKHISLKYSCADHWLYLRERVLDPDEESSRVRTVRFVSRRLLSSGSFSGPGYSWGDDQLAGAADGIGRGLGEMSAPVAYATSHHLAYLAGLHAA